GLVRGGELGQRSGEQDGRQLQRDAQPQHAATRCGVSGHGRDRLVVSGQHSPDDSRIVLDQLIGDGRRSTTDRVAVPQTLFMTPPLATVGLTEKAAREAGYRVKIGREAVADIVAMPRAYAVEETRGVMKFVIDAETDEILGAALLSVDAQELINTVALAMRHRIRATELRDAIYTHPSSTEAFNEVLGTIVRADEPRLART
ncbi:MAG: pyridine nucleotide-disulfide oxidoreductase, partial [Pseudonocardia sp.]|nr:pyridine nucleotide-disulfide oxidoreductase [Pseudonocardia sp.]